MLVFTVFTPEFLAGVVAAPFGLIRQKMAKQYTRVRSSYVYIYIYIISTPGLIIHMGSRLELPGRRKSISPAFLHGDKGGT